MEADKKSLVPLKEIIAGIMEDGTLPYDLRDAEIWKIWQPVVGPAISKHTRPLRVRNGLLRVGVDNSVWLQELQFMESDIRLQLNRELKREAIKKIDFRLESS